MTERAGQGAGEVARDRNCLPPELPERPSDRTADASNGSCDADHVVQWGRDKTHHIFDVARFRRLVVLVRVGCIVDAAANAPRRAR
jgi:hypothetical protein